MTEKSYSALRMLLALLLVLAPVWYPSAGNRVAVVLSVDSAIGPATADYIGRGLREAHERGAGLVILKMDTPGGLDTAMRDIIQHILVSPVPVATYVSPSGARAASAGTYILYASHIAAMAPGTNLGAATPVQIGGLPGAGKPKPGGANGQAPDMTDSGDALRHKQINDAVAYLKSLAQLRARNVEWAERAVREGASLTAQEALAQGVVDIVAADLQGLLVQTHGRKVTVAGLPQTLDTGDLLFETLAPDWRNRLLSVITDPNVAYILMLIGLYGLFFEFANPGFIVPGVVGAISLLLALYAFQVLPVNYAGLALLALGIIFMLGEAFVPSFGALGIGGVIAFVAGSVILFDKESTGYAVSVPLILGLALTSAGFFLLVVGAAIKARQRPVVSGAEQMLASVGEVVDGVDGKVRIRVHGEVWQAESAVPVKRGDKVRVVAVDGLVLKVQPVP